MAAPTTVDELRNLIIKSGMIPEAKVESYVRGHQTAGTLPTEPRKFASLLIRDGYLTYFQAEQFLLGKWRNFSLGKYKLMERIGFGGMGTVFLCEHTFMRRRVAIKVLPPNKAEDPAALGRFYREARSAALLDHPNIVRTHDIAQEGDLHFLVMEYVDGASFLDIVKKVGPFDVLRATHYMIHAAQGLQHAHQMGLVHRDIKPGNLMIDREGTCKILDMGLARILQDTNDNLTLKYDDKSVLGTADYVAPEQTVNSHDVDIRADIYGLGATFYYILAGHPPFPDGTIAHKLLYHQTKEPRSIREIRPEVPEGLAMVLAKMMAKDPNQRYQVPAEVADALAPWAREPIGPPPEEEMPKLSPAAQEGASVSGGLPAPVPGVRDSGSIRQDVFQRKGPSNPSVSIPDATGKPGSSLQLRPPMASPAAVVVPRRAPAATAAETANMAAEATPAGSRPAALPPLGASSLIAVASPPAVEKAAAPRFSKSPFAAVAAKGMSANRTKLAIIAAVALVIGAGIGIGVWLTMKPGSPPAAQTK
jgi:serine/threonine protein kinase